MRTTVVFDKDILDELMRVSGHKSKSTAVREAVAAYLRQRKRDKIRNMKGKLKFDLTAEEIRHYKRQGAYCSSILLDG